MIQHTSFPFGVLLSAVFASSWSSTPAHSAVTQVVPPAAPLLDRRADWNCPTAGSQPVDMRSLVRSGEAVLAIGRHAYVFPRNAQSRTSPIMRDSIIGAVIDRGNVSLVLSPVKRRKIHHPHAVADPNGSIHVLFATAGDTVPTFVDPPDTATLQYARLEKGKWRAVQRVGAVRGAALNQESSSDPLLRNGQLSFLFPFVDDRDSTSTGGVILLRRRDSRWSWDTLRTYRRPSAARARHCATGESIVAVFPQYGPTVDSIAERLYLARFDSAWSSRRVIAGDGDRAVMAPTVVARGDGFIASWNTWPVADPDSLRLEWLEIDANDRVSVRPVIDSGGATFPFEVVLRSTADP